MSVSKYMT